MLLGDLMTSGPEMLPEVMIESIGLWEPGSELMSVASVTTKVSADAWGLCSHQRPSSPKTLIWPSLERGGSSQKIQPIGFISALK